MNANKITSKTLKGMDKAEIDNVCYAAIMMDGLSYRGASDKLGISYKRCRDGVHRHAIKHGLMVKDVRGRLKPPSDKGFVYRREYDKPKLVDPATAYGDYRYQDIPPTRAKFMDHVMDKATGMLGVVLIDQRFSPERSSCSLMNY